MRFEKIEIKNYKSIKYVSFEIEKYGGSYTTILLGKNETGKSNILEAMALFDPKEDEVIYLDIVNQDIRCPLYDKGNVDELV